MRVISPAASESCRVEVVQAQETSGSAVARAACSMFQIPLCPTWRTERLGSRPPVVPPDFVLEHGTVVPPETLVHEPSSEMKWSVMVDQANAVEGAR